MALKLSRTSEELVQQGQRGLVPKSRLRAPSGVTLLVGGAWLGLRDKAQLSDQLCAPQRAEVPGLGRKGQVP